MTRPTVEGGFKFWHQEVTDDVAPEKLTPYIPVLAVIGVYTSFTPDPSKRTCFDWRRAVLQNEDAMDGLRMSVARALGKDELDDTYETPIESHKPADGAFASHGLIYDAILDGMPASITTIPENEYFLAKVAAFAIHDECAQLDPLRLLKGGMVALGNNYPRTAFFLEEQT